MFPVDARDTAYGYLQWSATNATHNQVLDRLDLGAHAVKTGAKAEPGIEAEDAFVFVYGLNDFLALVNGSAQRLLTPYILLI